MAVTVIEAVWKHSRAKGNARLVLLALADYVDQEKVKRGDRALAWPSQGSLAGMCRCSRSTVELALTALQEAGEIKDTGERHWGKYRGTLEWEVLPGVDLFPEPVTDSGSDSPKETDPRSAKAEPMTDPRSAAYGATGDLTDSGPHLTDSGPHLTDSGRRPDRPIGHKPGVNPGVNPEVRTRSAPAATDVSASQIQQQRQQQQRADLEAELENWEEALPSMQRKPDRLADAEARIADLKAELLALRAGVELTPTAGAA